MNVFLFSIVGCALMGYLVVTALMLMVFYPKRLAQIGPIKIQGLLRAYWPEISGIVVTMASEQGLSAEELTSKIEGLDLAGEAAPMIDDRLDAMIEGVKKKIPMVAMFLSSGPLVDSLKGQAKEELLSLIPELQTKFAGKLSRDFDPKALIEEKMKSVDFDRIEAKLQHVVQPSIKKGRLLGGLLGAIIGVLQGILFHFFC